LRNPTQIEPTMQSTILACNCGELLIVLGGEDEWVSEGRTSFECGACDSRITLPEQDERRGQERADYRSLSLGELLEELGAKKTG
jgi:hypothetical protein